VRGGAARRRKPPGEPARRACVARAARKVRLAPAEGGRATATNADWGGKGKAGRRAAVARHRFARGEEARARPRGAPRGPGAVTGGMRRAARPRAKAIQPQVSVYMGYPAGQPKGETRPTVRKVECPVLARVVGG
jgi:hypothetical protein